VSLTCDASVGGPERWWATFVIHMDRESLNEVQLGKYDVTVHIILFERDKEIAWNLGPDIPFPHFYGLGRFAPGRPPI
jgi:hypothetical protein